MTFVSVNAFRDVSRWCAKKHEQRKHRNCGSPGTRFFVLTKFENTVFLQLSAQTTTTMSESKQTDKMSLAATCAASAAVGFVSGALVWALAGRSRARSNTDTPKETKTEQLPATPAGPFNFADLVRPNIASLVPYRCARDDYDTGVLLDANENSHGPPMDGTDVCAPNLERYCSQQAALHAMHAKPVA